MTKPLAAVSLLLVSPLGLAACAKTPEQVMREVEIHILRLSHQKKAASSVSQIRRDTAAYEVKYRAELRALGEAAAELARKRDRKSQLVAHAYCLLWISVNQKTPRELDRCLLELPLGVLKWSSPPRSSAATAR